MKARKLPIRKCYVCGQKKQLDGYALWDKRRPEVGTGKRTWYICSDCENTQDYNPYVFHTRINYSGVIKNGG